METETKDKVSTCDICGKDLEFESTIECFNCDNYKVCTSCFISSGKDLEDGEAKCPKCNSLLF